jgi:antitoxin ParD1/3/4
MPTRNVVLTDHQEKLIDNLIGSGRYQNAGEVLREDLRLEQREAQDAAKLRSCERLDRGELKEFDSIDELRAHLNSLSGKIVSGSA